MGQQNGNETEKELVKHDEVFGFSVAVRMLEKGKVVKQRNAIYGYKLVPNLEYGNQKYRIAVVDRNGKTVMFTSFHIDQLLAKNWQVMDVG